MRARISPFIFTKYPAFLAMGVFNSVQPIDKLRVDIEGAFVPAFHAGLLYSLTPLPKHRDRGYRLSSLRSFELPAFVPKDRDYGMARWSAGVHRFPRHE